MERTSRPPFACCASLEGRAKVAASFTRRLLLLLTLRHGEMAFHSAAGLVHPRRTTVDDRATRIEVDSEPRTIHLVLLAIELDIADQGDELAIEVVDAEIPARGLGRAMNDYPVGSVETLDLHAAGLVLSARISNGQAGGVQRQLGLRHVNVPGKHGAVGAVLDFDPVGGDIHRSVAVVTLERG